MVNPEFHDEGFRVRHCLSCRKVSWVLTRWRRGVVEFSTLSCGLVNFSVALQFLGFRCGKVWSWWHHGWVFGIGGCFDVVFIGMVILRLPSFQLFMALHFPTSLVIWFSLSSVVLLVLLGFCFRFCGREMVVLNNDNVISAF